VFFLFWSTQHTLHLASNITTPLVRRWFIWGVGGIGILPDIRIEVDLWRKDIKNMMRQCAWCLRLIDSKGKRVSQLPFSKLYEASHGMCDVCGVQWLQQMLGASEAQETPLQLHNDATNTDEYVQTAAGYTEKPSRTTTRLAHELTERELEAVDVTLHII